MSKCGNYYEYVESWFQYIYIYIWFFYMLVKNIHSVRTFPQTQFPWGSFWSHFCAWLSCWGRFPPPLSPSRTLLLFCTNHFADLFLCFIFQTVLFFLLFLYAIFLLSGLSNILTINFDSIHCSHTVKAIDISDYSDSLLVKNLQIYHLQWC